MSESEREREQACVRGLHEEHWRYCGNIHHGVKAEHKIALHTRRVEAQRIVAGKEDTKEHLNAEHPQRCLGAGRLGKARARGHLQANKNTSNATALTSTSSGMYVSHTKVTQENMLRTDIRSSSNVPSVCSSSNRQQQVGVRQRTPQEGRAINDQTYSCEQHKVDTFTVLQGLATRAYKAPWCSS